MKGYPVIVRPNNHALNKEHIQQLWEVSERITKVKYVSL
jgi:hypothetical protein